jgi:hypothetical protein
LEHLKNFKKNLPAGSDEILECESILNRQTDLELRAEIENLRSFEYLNDEKITPFFVSLAKGSNASASTDSICNQDGVPFQNSDDREKFVRNFYANLYKIPPDQRPAPNGCIEELLGKEICNSDMVRKSRITQEQREMLEHELTIEELDISAAQGNKSAAGMVVLVIAL